MPVTTVVVRNTQDGIVVLGSNQNANDYVTWEAAGDQAGGDVRFVPGSLAETAGFRTALARGILVLEDDENDQEVVDALQKQVDAYKRRTAKSEAVSATLVDRDSGRDVITQFCVGPNARGNGDCGASVTVSEKKKATEPPLCNQHVHLKHQYIPEEILSTDGPATQWTKVSIDKRN